MNLVNKIIFLLRLSQKRTSLEKKCKGFKNRASQRLAERRNAHNPYKD
jgi:hypothetical protein